MITIKPVFKDKLLSSFNDVREKISKTESHIFQLQRVSEMLLHSATMASPGRQLEQRLQLSEENESEYSPDLQALQGTGTLFGTALPQ